MTAMVVEMCQRMMTMTMMALRMPRIPVLSERPDCFFQRIHAVDQLAAPLVINFPFRCQDKWPLGAVDQLDAEMFFQMMNHLADARLRNRILVGGLGKAATAHDITKHLETLGVHSGSLPIIYRNEGQG